jgi:hypothetical protein
MFSPLEDEKFQIGVIFVASISIVAFLLQLASQNVPEAVPIARTAAPELSEKAEPVAGIPDRGTEEARPRDLPPQSDEAIDDAALSMRASLPLPSLRGAEGDEAIQGPYWGSGQLRIARNDAHKARYLRRGVGRSEEVVQKKGRARRSKRGFLQEPWQGPLPNKKGDPDD